MLRRQLLDRLAHHGHMAETGNDFCRFGYSNATAKSKIKARAQTKPSGTVPFPENTATVE